MDISNISKVQKRPSNRNQQYYMVTYSDPAGITTILDKDGETIKEWINQGKTVDEASS
tara:strand:- start:65 stop:238 length:174 start_codon:yes stop_codon:yes gene_type:complete